MSVIKNIYLHNFKLLQNNTHTHSRKMILFTICYRNKFSSFTFLK